MAAALRSVYVWMIFSLSFIYLCSSQNENEFIYNNGFNEANLTLDEITKIHPSGLLQLTNNSELTKGHAFYPFPLKFNTSSPESLSFSTNFVFAMVPESVNNGGHGIAFVISPSMNFTGAIAGHYLGLFNLANIGKPTNHILAVEVDTVQSPEFYDIDGNHVGIDVNGLVSNESATATYYSNEEGNNKSLLLMSGDPIQIWIDYDGAEKLLNVTLSPIGIAKPERPLLSTPLNLSEVLLDLYDGASTEADKHKTLISPSFLLFPAHGKASKKLLMIVLIVVAVAVFFVVVIVAAYIVWKKKYEEVCEDWEREYGPQRFPYKNLYKATKGFKDTEVIGKGGFGKVYRGVLPSNEANRSQEGLSRFGNKG
ncbi:hypothetical protein Pint_32755 [Pistacia integerrima]|uniref:Uncharacterized protein n=1 Tax=Pistacia integerrima TaxID=434235 RepID=A0ACC0XSF5_9ROSI|nr:hypothetical protein Pint_32755 [Pistacia integerrima]